MQRILAVGSILASSLAFLSPAFAEEDRPPREAYTEALVAAYEENLLALGATQAQSDEFGECVLEGTYEQMSVEAVRAIAAEDMDYALDDEDADIFLEATEVCLEQSELADLVLEDAGVDTSEFDGADSTAAGAEGGEASGLSARSEGEEAGNLDASSAASPESANTEASDSPSWRLPAAAGLILLSLIGAAAYLVVANRARAAS